MGHVQDRWFKRVRDPETGELTRVRTELHGKGDRYRVRYLDPDGVERSRSFPDRQKKAADEFLIAVESDKREGRYINARAGKVTFREYAESWLKGQSDDAATRQTIGSRLRSQLYPFFERRALSSITPAMVREWLDWLLGKGLGASYRSVLFELLSSILGAAVEEKRIHENPCRAKSIKKPKGAPRKVVPWSASRLRAMQLALPLRSRIVIPLGAGCGLRQGEILGFSADDVDRDAMVVNVVRQLRVVGRTLVFAPPKRGKTRTVPISESVLGSIDGHVREFPPVAVTLPWAEPQGRPVTVWLLLSTDDGGVRSGDLFNKVVWKPAFARAGLTYVNREDGMHALRHFFASALLAQGVSVKELAEYLGHTDPGFTLRTYTHLVPSSHQRARAAVDKVFRPGRRRRTSDGLGTA
ncbi:MAG: tyrosine-type recombinase/integrase [Pseudonocardiaceae bacterium]|nr:tyrosine-type recombinase/integrase [Pseudonocardiaceae bacterium]